MNLFVVDQEVVYVALTTKLLTNNKHKNAKICEYSHCKRSSIKQG